MVGVSREFATFWNMPQSSNARVECQHLAVVGNIPGPAGLRGENLNLPTV